MSEDQILFLSLNLNLNLPERRVAGRMLKKAVQQGRSELSLNKGLLGWSQLRASNEGSMRPRVARARGSSQPPRLLFQHPAKFVGLSCLDVRPGPARHSASAHRGGGGAQGGAVLASQGRGRETSQQAAVDTRLVSYKRDPLPDLRGRVDRLGRNPSLRPGWDWLCGRALKAKGKPPA